MLKNTIDILLPTYNGEKFIKEQIESVLNQSYENWRLLVRDDGSSDNTIEIVRDYAVKFPQKFIFIEEDKSHLGVCQSFAQLTLVKEGREIRGMVSQPSLRFDSLTPLE